MFCYRNGWKIDRGCMIERGIYFGIILPKAIDISYVSGFIFIVTKVVFPVAGAGREETAENENVSQFWSAIFHLAPVKNDSWPVFRQTSVKSILKPGICSNLLKQYQACQALFWRITRYIYKVFSDLGLNSSDKYILQWVFLKSRRADKKKRTKTQHWWMKKARPVGF